MKIVFMLVLMIMADRALPAQVRRVAGAYFETTPVEFYKRYGRVSFPRTLFMLLAIASAALEYFLDISQVTEGLIAIFFIVLWTISAAIDTFRARR